MDRHGGLPMTMRDVKPADWPTVISWIPGPDACRNWAGPQVRYPLNAAFLKADIGFEPGNAFCLEHRGQTVAFGQILLKSDGRRHLARIIVAPGERGKGFGRKLCRALIDRALQTGCRHLTLNVYADNAVAVSLYEKLGFAAADPPAAEPLPQGVVAMAYRLPA